MHSAQIKKFTLIELIITIIILVVLSIMAIPKMLDLKNEAELSAADGVFGSVQGAVHIAYAESKVNDTALPTSIINGYLEADQAEGWEGTGLAISKDVDGDGLIEYVITVNNATDPPEVTRNW